jgi:hypothetical protein
LNFVPGVSPCPTIPSPSFAKPTAASPRAIAAARGGRARERIAALDQRVAEAGDKLIDAALKQAKAGNVKAIEAPEIRATRDLLPATAAVTNALLNGDVTPREAAARDQSAWRPDRAGRLRAAPAGTQGSNRAPAR